MVWVNKEVYNGMIEQNKKLEKVIVELKSELEEIQNDSGESIIKRLTHIAKEAKIDVHSEEYQTMMARVFMDIGGRITPVLKAYSKTAFLKDNPEELLERLKEFTKNASVITRGLEDKSKKK